VIDKKSAALGAAATVLAALVVFTAYSFVSGGRSDDEAPSSPHAQTAGASAGKAPTVVSASVGTQTIELSSHEFPKFKVEPVRDLVFQIHREAVGNIDFNQEMLVQVFTPFQGRIISLYARAGDDVPKGATLFTIDSPDLLDAESKLIAAAGALNVTTRVLARAKQLFEIQGVSQKDLDQATADQHAAEGALRAARNAVRIFGKSDADMDRIVAERRVDSILEVHSPISGRITARNAAPGLLVQPGNQPAPFVIADISTMWMVASVPETDFPFLARGQELDVSVSAYPGRVFRGKVVRIGAAVDPNTRRLDVRSQVRDPRHELRPGMFATFVIRTGRTERSLAVPVASVVREGDGTMSVWVNTDDNRLAKRTVTIGLQQEGLQQILEGLRPGEKVATTGALFLSNALTAASR
jgi:cobalt-zinc-cadmium efflux system membrane fusion protein